MQVATNFCLFWFHCQFALLYQDYYILPRYIHCLHGIVDRLVNTSLSMFLSYVSCKDKDNAFHWRQYWVQYIYISSCPIHFLKKKNILTTIIKQI